MSVLCLAVLMKMIVGSEDFVLAAVVFAVLASEPLALPTLCPSFCLVSALLFLSPFVQI